MFQRQCFGPQNAKNQLIEAGCHSCSPYELLLGIAHLSQYIAQNVQEFLEHEYDQ